MLRLDAMRCLGTIALVLALCTTVHAGDKVDWSQYLEKGSPATASPAKKSVQPAKPAAKTPAKAKPKPVARTKAKRR